MTKTALCFGIILLIIVACKPLAIPSNLTESDVLPLQSDFIFPMDWIGVYTGELLIYDNSGDSTSISMKLQIDNPNAAGFYPWTLTYGDGDIRSYGLEAINPEKGHFRIDEFNSIKIDAYLRGNHLISRFAVMDSDLIIDYEKTSEGIAVHLYITKAKQYNESGGERIGNEKVPLVASFPLMVFQKAFLQQQ